MLKVMALPLLCLLALPAQENKEEDIRDRIKEVEKNLSSGKADTRLAAIKELGNLRHADARALLTKKLNSDSDQIRLAAARALIRHRHAVCAKALANAIQLNMHKTKLVKGYIEALGDLDMCVGISILIKLMHSNTSLAPDCLKQLGKIGCPEALKGILLLLQNAEKEAKKPDTFSDLGIGNRNNRGGLLGRNTGQNRNNPRNTQNKNKDHKLAALVGPARDALKELTGKQFKDHQAWSRHFSSKGMPMVNVSVYFCEHTGKTFEMPGSRPPKCPFENAPKGHKDTFQKHRNK